MQKKKLSRNNYTKKNGGTRGVTVFVVGNGHSDTNQNSMGQADFVSKENSYSIGPCTKKKLSRNNYTKKKWRHSWCNGIRRRKWTQWYKSKFYGSSRFFLKRKFGFDRTMCKKIKTLQKQLHKKKWRHSWCNGIRRRKWTQWYKSKFYGSSRFFLKRKFGFDRTMCKKKKTLQKQLHKKNGGTRGVTVFVVGNGHSDTNQNSMGQADFFSKENSDSIGPCAKKKNSPETTTQKKKWRHSWCNGIRRTKWTQWFKSKFYGSSRFCFKRKFIFDRTMCKKKKTLQKQLHKKKWRHSWCNGIRRTK